MRRGLYHVAIADSYFSACSSSGSPEVNQMNHVEAVTMPPPFPLPGAGGYAPSLYGVVNGSNIPKIFKEFLPEPGFYASSSE